MALNLINVAPRVFISYARQDAANAGSINTSLLEDGYTNNHWTAMQYLSLKAIVRRIIEDRRKPLEFHIVYCQEKRRESKEKC